MKKKETEKTQKGDYTYPENDLTSSMVCEPSPTYYAHHQDRATRRTISIMGMQSKHEYSEIQNDNDFIGVIRSGIPKAALTHLMDIADLTLIEMANIVHTTDRNLRRYTPTQKLPRDQSEGIVEVAKLYSRGEEVFGNMEQFRKWMNTVLLPFGNKKPKEFLDTSLGIGMIMNELGRIEHGILA
jgi:putative toxin-antitoxin system antitoxin component (TIGR02293 family)